MAQKSRKNPLKELKPSVFLFFSFTCIQYINRKPILGSNYSYSTCLLVTKWEVWNEEIM